VEEPWLVLMGVLDGLNVCSLSLLALFISLMYSAGQGRRTILSLGVSYIAGVFAAYLATGLGILLLSVTLPAVPHLLARVGVSIMILIGASNILSYFGLGLLPLSMPSTLGARAVVFMRRVGLFSSAAAGILVGLHNFPCACTGGVYPTFIGLIATSSLKLAYLLLYNIFFISPLVLILYIASTKAITVRLRKWHQENKQRSKLIIGVIMVALGAFFLALIFLGVQ